MKMKVHLSRQMSNDSFIVYLQADDGLCAIFCDGHEEYQVLIEEEKLCHATCGKCRNALSHTNNPTPAASRSTGRSTNASAAKLVGY